MSENPDPLHLKRQPELFKEMSINLAKEISSLVRANKTEEGFQQEVLNKCVDEPLEKHLSLLIDELWKEYKLEDKAKELVALADAETSQEPAWRPTTGAIYLDPLYVKGITYKKNKLENKVAEQEEHIRHLETILTTKRKELDELMIAMVKGMDENSDMQ